MKLKYIYILYIYIYKIFITYIYKYIYYIYIKPKLFNENSEKHSLQLQFRESFSQARYKEYKT